MRRLLLTLMLISLAGCVRNPVTGQRQFVLISESQEIAIGRDNHPAILAEFGRVEDEAVQSYLTTIGNKLAAVSHRPALDWNFTVVDSPVVNAFAVPGGFVYFTRGILAHMNSEAEVAGVMGHEIGHVTARHSVQQMTRTQLAQLGLAVGSIVSPTFGRLGGAAESTLGLLFLRNGRDAERESDRLGEEYAARGGYDPNQMSSFFAVLQRLSAATDRQSLPGWLSTHPDPGERIETTRALSQEWLLQLGLDAGDLTVKREAHLRNLEGMVYGNNPREGFSEDGRFYHPELEFQIDFPSDWQVDNTRSAVYVIERQQQAQMELRLANVPEGTTARQYVRQLESEGLSPSSGAYRAINGNQAFIGVYNLSGAGGSQPILVAFIEFDGRLYQILGAAGDLSRYGDIMERSILTFNRLTDRRILAVRPDRLTLYTSQSGDTPQILAARLANPRVDAEELSLLNQISPTATLPAGTLVKLVEPGY
jgi:predicted Zn-dependent protease